MVGVALHDAAVCEYDLCADETIAGQAVLAPEDPEPAVGARPRVPIVGEAVPALVADRVVPVPPRWVGVGVIRQVPEQVLDQRHAGGTVGVGTVLYAVAIGPTVQFFLPMFRMRPREPAIMR